MSWEKAERDYTTILRRDTLRDVTEAGIGGAEAEAEVERRIAAGDNFGDIVESLAVALDLEGRVAEDMPNPLWNIRTAEVIRIIRQERAAVRREEVYKLREDAKAEAARREMQTGGGWRGEAED